MCVYIICINAPTVFALASIMNKKNYIENIKKKKNENLSLFNEKAWNLCVYTLYVR